MKYSFITIIFISLFISCSITAPGFNESNVEYTIVFTADNQTDDSLLVVSSSDSVTIFKNRTYVWTKTYSWTEDNNDEDNATMTSTAVSNLTETIYFYNYLDSLILVYSIVPTKSSGESISSVCFDHYDIVIP